MKPLMFPWLQTDDDENGHQRESAVSDATSVEGAVGGMDPNSMELTELIPRKPRRKLAIPQVSLPTV